MYYTVNGLVLREAAYKESDKILTLLTDEMGRMTVKARGVRRKNSPLRAGCQLLTYGEFTLYERKGYYTVNEVEPLRLFDGLRQDIELLSLGSYFAQLLETVSAEGQSDPEVLNLGLNCLYALEQLKRPQALVKAVFELRLLCLIGFAPRLEGCGRCGAPAASCFLLQEGILLCDSCKAGPSTGPREILSPGVLAVMRHIVSCEKKKLFSFTLSEPARRELAQVAERFLLTQLGQSFSALEFYKRLFPQVNGGAL